MHIDAAEAGGRRSPRRRVRRAEGSSRWRAHPPIGQSREDVAIRGQQLGTRSSRSNRPAPVPHPARMEWNATDNGDHQRPSPLLLNTSPAGRSAMPHRRRRSRSPAHLPRRNRRQHDPQRKMPPNGVRQERGSPHHRSAAEGHARPARAPTSVSSSPRSRRRAPARRYR